MCEISDDGGMSLLHPENTDNCDGDEANNGSSGNDVKICKLIPELTDDEIRDLEFACENDVVEFYNNYAMFKIFGTRKDDVPRD